MFRLERNFPASAPPLTAPLAGRASGKNRDSMPMLLASVDFLEWHKKRPYKPSSRPPYQPALDARPVPGRPFRKLPTVRPPPLPVEWAPIDAAPRQLPLLQPPQSGQQDLCLLQPAGRGEERSQEHLAAAVLHEGAAGESATQ